MKTKSKYSTTRALLVLLLAIVSQAAFAEFKVVGYMPSWAGDVNQVQYSKLTHINYSFVLPNGDGSLQGLDNTAKLQSLVSLSHNNGVKVLIAVGGWNDGNDSNFENLAANSTYRNNFVNNLINLVNQYGLDGVDIDWEYPDGGSSANNYATLMQQLSSAMHSRGKLLTAAVVSDGGGSILNSVFSSVDFLNLMAYDGGGSNHSTYSLAVNSLNYWIGRGLPASKAVLGVPFYGRSSSEYVSYRDLLSRGANPNSDFFGSVGYNGIPTIKSKTNLAFDRSAGGVMMWELSQDVNTSNSLLTAINQVVVQRSGSNPPTPTSLATGKAVTVSSTEAGANVAANAVDGNGGTRWSSTYSDAQWIYVDLGASYNVNRVKLNWEAAYGRDYQVQVSSNATSWTTIKTVTGNTSLVNDHTGLSGTGRYVRINGTARGTVYGYSLYEIEIYGTPSNPPTSTNLALNKPTSVSTVEVAGMEGSKAVDGSGSTRWSSAYANSQHLYVDLGARYNINRVKINWEAAYASYFQVQTSTDNVTWTTIRDVPNNTSLTNDLTGLSATARYVKIYCVTRATTYGFSIFELEVYGTYVGARLSAEIEGLDKSTVAFPNPTTDKVTIQLAPYWQKAGKIGLVNASGKALVTEAVKGPEHTFDLSTLPTGLYIINISNQTDRTFHKVLKQ